MTNDKFYPLPIKISPEERQYYIDVWGLDPVKDRMPTKLGGYKYEAEFPLANDPQLTAADITIIARVAVDIQMPTTSWVDIVFRMYQNEKHRSQFSEKKVGCVHGVIFQGLVEEIGVITDEQMLGKKIASNKGKYNFPHKGFTPINLPPWAHFVALRSFVAAIAEIGLGNLMRTSTKPENCSLSNRIGFNAAMQSGIVKALSYVSGGTALSFLVDFWMELVESASLDWLGSHKIALDEAYSVKKMANVLRVYAPLDWVIAHVTKLREIGGESVNLENLNGTEYYQEVWGFDPSLDRHYEGNDRAGYHYEAKFPLINDPLLIPLNVTLNAYQTSTLSRGAATLILEIPQERFFIELNVPACYDEFVISFLQPWERFVVLRSNAAAIAELGIANVLNDVADFSDETLLAAFGFTPKTCIRFAHMFFGIIEYVDVQKGKACLAAWYRRFIELTPFQWFVNNIAMFERNDYRFENILKFVLVYSPPEWIGQNLVKAQIFLPELRPRDNKSSVV